MQVFKSAVIVVGSPHVPGVLGTKEAGLPANAIEFWYGLFAPAGTPEPIVNKIFESVQIALADQKAKAALARKATDVDLSKSPEQFDNSLTEDAKFWVKLVKSAGVTFD